MRILLTASIMFIAIGIVMARMADQPAPSAQASASNRTSNVAVAQSAGGRRVVIPSDKRGHFQTDAMLGGHSVQFLVDTGASIVALNESTAKRLGIRTAASDPKVKLQTANGAITATQVRLASIDIKGLQVQDVDAVVLPDTALSQNLLGMSFLSRLTRSEYRSGQLVLER